MPTIEPRMEDLPEGRMAILASQVLDAFAKRHRENPDFPAVPALADFLEPFREQMREEELLTRIDEATALNKLKTKRVQDLVRELYQLRAHKKHFTL